MTDCVYFQTIIKELNPGDNNTGDCCTWSMVECDNTGSIVKLDFSNYKGIDKKVSFSQTIQFLTKLKEFNINGQKNINEIYSLPTENLEKIDVSNSGMTSSMFPTWILDAPKIKEIDISNTQITGVPQRNLKSSAITGCNFQNTPICTSYQSSPYANYIPDACKSSCSGSSIVSSNSSVGGKKTSGGTPVWPFIVIGVVIVAILGAVGFLYMKKSKKRDNIGAYDSPRPILPVAKVDKREDESLEISVEENITPNTVAAAAVSVPPAAAVVKHDLDDKKIEEVARNNYSIAYGGDANQSAFSTNNNRASGASVKDIYRQHNASAISTEQDQSYYPHPSIYNTMTADDSDDDVSGMNESIIKNIDLKDDKEKSQEQQPALLRRKSSRKANLKQTTAPAEEPKQEMGEIYIANWDYTPSLSDELALVAGDVIEIKKKFDDGWSTGYNRRTKQTGIVPLCYLKEYED